MCLRHHTCRSVHRALTSVSQHLLMGFRHRYRLHFANSGGNAETSNTTTRACFANPLTISYPKPELPPVMITSSSFPGPNLNGAPSLPNICHLFQARLFKAPLTRRTTPRPVSTFRMVIKVVSLAAPFLARRLVWNGWRNRCRKWTGPRVRMYNNAPVRRGSCIAPVNVDTTVDAISSVSQDEYTSSFGNVTLMRCYIRII
jgi:hypothetical protein